MKAEVASKITSKCQLMPQNRIKNRLKMLQKSPQNGSKVASTLLHAKMTLLEPASEAGFSAQKS